MNSVFSSKYFVRKTFVIHPFLFAIFPILFLFAHNIGEISVDNQVLIPIIVSIVFALLLWALLSLIFKDVLKAGLATSLFLFFFFFYGRFYDLLERWDVFVPKHSVFLPGVLLVWGYCTYFIKRARRDFKNISKILNMLALVLIVINIFTIATHQLLQERSSASQMHEQQNSVAVKSSKMNDTPDIYYIILDEYAHPDTMREYYNYDNSQFIRNLRDKGFFVAHGSRTKVMKTLWSIASTLNMANMEYYSPETERDEVMYPKIIKNSVVEYLRSINYKYIYFGSWAEIGKYKMDADFYYNFYVTKDGGVFSKKLSGEFNHILLNTIMLKPFYRYLTEKCFKFSYRNGTLGTIEQLKQIQYIKSPKFIFAHIMCPHYPFVFGPNAEEVDYANWYNFKDKQFYQGQYIFITREIEKVIEELLKKSEIKPIIIIQSDHGIRPYHRRIRTEIIGENEWRKILNAYYLPGDGKKHLYESISPVNSFRVIFNHYFGAQYKLLED